MKGRVRRLSRTQTTLWSGLCLYKSTLSLIKQSHAAIDPILAFKLAGWRETHLLGETKAVLCDCKRADRKANIWKLFYLILVFIECNFWAFLDVIVRVCGPAAGQQAARGLAGLDGQATAWLLQGRGGEERRGEERRGEERRGEERRGEERRGEERRGEERRGEERRGEERRGEERRGEERRGEEFHS